MRRLRMLSVGVLGTTIGVVMACAESTAPQPPASVADRHVAQPSASTAATASASASDASRARDERPSKTEASSEAVAAQALPLKISVVVHPGNRMTSDQAREMYLSFELTNTGSENVKADIGDSVLLVNGRPLKQWASTMAELDATERAKNLAPNETMRFHFKFAKKVVVKPGDYSFEVKVGTLRSTAVVVTVTP